MPSTLNTFIPVKVNISNDVLFQNMGEEYVLLNMKTEKYFGLDAVAARFWQLFAENASTENALLQVQSEFEVEEETVKRDLLAFLQKLLAEELVTVEN